MNKVIISISGETEQIQVDKSAFSNLQRPIWVSQVSVTTIYYERIKQIIMHIDYLTVPVDLDRSQALPTKL